MNYIQRIYDLLVEGSLGQKRNERRARAIEKAAQGEAHKTKSSTVDTSKSEERTALLNKMQGATRKAHSRTRRKLHAAKKDTSPDSVKPNRSDMLSQSLRKKRSAHDAMDDLKQDLRGGSASWQKPLPKGRTRFDR